MEEKLSNIVHNYIKEAEILDMDEFSFTVRLIEIFEKHYKCNNYDCHKRKVSFEKSYKYSYDFIKSIDPEYAECLDLLKRDNNIEVLKPPKGENTNEYLKRIQKEKNIEILDSDNMTAYTVNDNGVNKILMPFQNTLIDSYILTHEFFHTISLSPDEAEASSIFCESLTFCAELLQDEYFHKNKVKEHQINKNQMLMVVYESIEELKIKLELIDIYLNNGVITANDISELLKKSNDVKVAFDVILNIMNTKEISTVDDERYIVGLIFAYYIFDRIHTDKSIEEFKGLNEMIDDYVAEEFVSYLDLEYVEESDIFELTEESYQKLEKSFVKVLKGRY